MLGRQKVLWVCIPPGIEEDSVLDHICQEHHGSIFLTAPPRSKGIEAIAIFVCNLLVNPFAIAHWPRCLQLCLVGWLEFIFEKDLDLGRRGAEYAEVDRPVQQDLATLLFNGHLIDDRLPSRFVTMIFKIWSGVCEADK